MEQETGILTALNLGSRRDIKESVVGLALAESSPRADSVGSARPDLLEHPSLVYNEDICLSAQNCQPHHSL